MLKSLYREIVDYAMIALGMVFYSIGWVAFFLPNNISTGGVAGLASIIFWGTGIPVQVTYFVGNTILLAIALKVLGLKFCIKTIYGVLMLTAFTTLFRHLFPHPTILHGEPFMACIIGSCFCGVGLGFGLAYHGSSGGSDIVASIINKYRDISLGRVILLCDIIIVTLSYVVLHSWEQVIYGFVGLIVVSSVLDQVVSSGLRSVQFLIISERYEEICRHVIETPPYRSCTVIDAKGYYSGNSLKVLILVTRQREASQVFKMIDAIDPHAFVTQSPVIGVYGNGFDRFKVKRKKNEALLKS
ncbi:MAG: YitT family protein [Prevotella sp.]|jgi:yitT family protein|uniref:DUF2179 domain-containing protein n=1 Tax=Hoylesella saccharolytica F0055 TaxID=1127699 RepID=L1MZE6_9BACT|nr:YitT family protein [Hoylesella saccharolytica]EKX96673.1 hypothetical protein HMPREF9151_02407 [Hoylesella saccharolytica F0055]RKW59453.1 MAG: YitT family protein [Prevotella sp.]